MKRYSIYISLLCISLLFSSCKNNSENESLDPQKEVDTTISSEIPMGKKYLETKCNLCHSLTAGENERIAPPMIAIKRNYMNSTTSKEEFIAQFTDFVKDPTNEKALMSGAINKFGVMPKQAFPENEVLAIANYVYDFEIETPAGFEEHWGKQHGKGKFKQKGRRFNASNQVQTSEEIGMNYALTTKKLLGKNLMGTIQKKGTEEAFKFCNVQAIPLTDSIANKENVLIKRVSDLPRNSANSANKKELNYIENYKSILSKGEKYNSIVEEKNDSIHFYYPIVTNSMCLQCHGSPKHQIEQKTLALISDLYPEDKAINYSENEVRGIWSIHFKI
ncbi:MAG: DUF3365 domain-containing protein [Flavobacteriaceae bacterium]|nr:DUF3365 domain-containing protein [Flavobacteriaceae bacterium]